MSPIAANLQAIRRRISEALQGDSRDISIVAVAKGQPPEAIRAAFAAGCRDFGESYAQEGVPKIAKLRDLGATWHFIGHLQGNKARDVAQGFDWVHGIVVDSKGAVYAADTYGQRLQKFVPSGVSSSQP